MNDNGRRH